MEVFQQGMQTAVKICLKRIETMVLMGVDMPVEAIRGQMASAIDVIIHLGRSYDGSRRLTGDFRNYGNDNRTDSGSSIV